MDSMLLNAFDTLALVLQFGVASVGVLLAVAFAMVLLRALAPFSPSDALGDVSESLTVRESDIYNATQWRLHESRARRRALNNGDASTRRMSDATIPDLSLVQSFPVVVAPVMVIA